MVPDHDRPTCAGDSIAAAGTDPKGRSRSVPCRCSVSPKTAGIARLERSLLGRWRLRGDGAPRAGPPRNRPHRQLAGRRIARHARIFCTHREAKHPPGRNSEGDGSTTASRRSPSLRSAVRQMSSARRRMGSNRHLSANSGLPAIVVLGGFTSDGLPVGLEQLGRAWSEPQLSTSRQHVTAARRRARRLSHIKLLGR